MNETPVERTELLVPEPSQALARLLDIESPTEELPELWHWIHLLPKPSQKELGPDGHPTTGLPAPPAPNQKRMFAGGRVVHHRLLRFGAPATKVSRLASTTVKDGRHGPLTFACVRHEISQDGELAIAEEQDIVYLTPTSGESGGNEPIGAANPQELAPLSGDGPALDLNIDETVLFRFSALTYNAHRIHYDLGWAKYEGYGSLVVHGPLQALMMGELLRREGGGLLGKEFAFRLVAPMVGPQTLRVQPGPDGLVAGVEVSGGAGFTTARATVRAARPE